MLITRSIYILYLVILEIELPYVNNTCEFLTMCV